jgi:hypothetical protein
VIYFNHATNGNRKPTFLDFGAKYPNETFTALVWEDDLSKFSYSLKSLEGKNICVTGVITFYNSKPEIIVHEPKQIKINN